MFWGDTSLGLTTKTVSHRANQRQMPALRVEPWSIGYLGASAHPCFANSQGSSRVGEACSRALAQVCPEHHVAPPAPALQTTADLHSFY